jgi:hypothetical protein
MERRFPWLWIGVAAALLLVPTSAGRLLLDVIGGLTLALLLLPLLAGGVALIGWQFVKSRLRTCPSCGFTSLGTDICPACGSTFTPGDGQGATAPEPSNAFFWGSGSGGEIDARDVTITVDAVDVEANAGGEPRGKIGDGS